MDAKITVIAPFPGMQAIAQEVVAERMEEWPAGIDVRLGDLSVGLSEAFAAIREGADVIVSRGGTASLISSQVETPVVEIPITAFDILRALRQIGDYSSPVGVVGFRNVIYGCEDLHDIWGVELKEITLGNEGEAQEKIAKAARMGIRAIIGDAISARLAIRYGLEGILIQSGKEAIYKALRQAQLLANVRRKEQERVELLQTIISSSTDGIVAVDGKSRITIFNPAAEDVFQMRSADVLGRNVGDVIPNTRLPLIVARGQSEIGEIQRIGARTIATKRIPIKLGGKVVGAIANFQDVTQLQRFEQTVRQKLYDKGLVAKVNIDQVIGCSSYMTQVKEKARQYATVDSTVLVTGETGTGKEMLAQGVHNLSRRRQGPFVAVNCAALPETLLESELFGYEEGAFTGAKKGGKSGLFELAHGGTIFLDEIGEMPLALQARILRVLQEREVMRLGGDRVIPIDIRVIAATNQDLLCLIRERRFRSDLYYRLDILRLHIPPLRERREDIRVLADAFLHKHFALNPKVNWIADEAYALLELHLWPGNVRELANIIERTVLLTPGQYITADDFRATLGVTTQLVDNIDLGDTLQTQEMASIRRVLREEQYNYSRAATRLGINRTTLWRKLRQ
ncbi:Fis family transcriptional regulator [Anaerosporomusa subterranea]|uniref:Fis family transcriptional regulator n=1 Tax=Anaerosporomusa subterranea TaxID=1794912 RepID=A0A154BMI1_ANASB|nr:sigma-54-dependent Fis family transcriptional regulator [Anaerosporomusa subterranea]KYZ75085.1 Fis family transcriptional regulator [Anaerosporomusa subterranea]